jgi:hypothetical protein
VREKSRVAAAAQVLVLPVAAQRDPLQAVPGDHMLHHVHPAAVRKTDILAANSDSVRYSHASSRIISVGEPSNRFFKVLWKKNVAVIFATQSLSDIADSAIAPAIIENCPTRIFLPNGNALEERTRKVYESFGLNERQLQILQQSIPKRDYYYQSREGNRLFELGLGELALAFCAAGAPQDHARIEKQ